jgi:glutamate-1-semialdehyde aminotransferase
VYRSRHYILFVSLLILTLTHVVAVIGPESGSSCMSCIRWTRHTAMRPVVSLTVGHPWGHNDISVALFAIRLGATSDAA